MRAELDELRESIRRLVGERTDPAARWAALVDVGACGLAGELEAAGVVAEVLGGALDESPWAWSCTGAATAVAGTSWAKAIEAGALTGTVALAAPGPRTGSGAVAPAGPGAVARPGRGTGIEVDGDGRLTGVAGLVPHAEAAGVLVIQAGSALFAVEAGAPGLAVEPHASLDLASATADVTLDATPATALTADPEVVRDRLGVVLLADGVGCAAAALDLAVAYAKDRRQFDVPIGSFQAVQHVCADMLRDLELARAATDEALTTGTHLAATMAMAVAPEALVRVGASTIQVLGGIGFTWDHPAHRHYRRLAALEATLGTTGEHLDELARLVVDQDPVTSQIQG